MSFETLCSPQTRIKVAAPISLRKRKRRKQPQERAMFLVKTTDETAKNADCQTPGGEGLFAADPW
jgi:hypothetical protein